MTSIAIASPPPALLKARRRHTIAFITLLVPLLCFTAPILGGAPHEMLDMAGYAAVLVCVLGRSYSSLFVGGIKNKRIVQEGIYSVVRNPLYVFSFIGLVGIGLQSGRVSVLVLLVAAFAYYYRKVVSREEAFLRHQFGHEYEQYCQRTPRWVPNFALWHAPEEITIRPRFVLNTMRDAMIFCAPLVLFELVELMQESAILTTYFNLP